MLLRKRRIAEDWNVDLSGDSHDANPTFRERLAGSNALWAVCTLAIATVCVLFVLSAFNVDKKSKEAPLRRIGQPVGTFDDYKHTEFMQTLARREDRRGIKIKARYVADDEIHIIVSSDISSDEMNFIVRYAGVGTMNRFGKIPSILVYGPSEPGGPPDKLIATATWSSRNSDFIVRIKR